MSVDLNWETLTTGPDGEELAHRIRDFIHAKFQTVPLPRFIKSVTVHNFQFGTIAPQLELKDITDPLPDFYEEFIEDEEDEEDEKNDDDDGGDSVGGSVDEEEEMYAAYGQQQQRRHPHQQHRHASDALTDDHSRRRRQHMPPPIHADGGRRAERALRAAAAAAGPGGGSHHRHDLGGGSLQGMMAMGPGGGGPGVATGGVPGGTSNLLHHFHSHLTPGWSGTQTPLAAMAGVHLSNSGAGGGGLPGAPHQYQNYQNLQQQYFDYLNLNHQEVHPPSHSRNPSHSSSISSASRPPTRDATPIGGLTGLTPLGSSSGAAAGLLAGSAIEEDEMDHAAAAAGGAANASAAAGGSPQQQQQQRQTQQTPPVSKEQQQGHHREPRPEDMQAVFRIRYAGDIKLLLTADILLDYPMPSFVGIPVRLSITGLSFDGVGVLAYIRKHVHFCFLSPEDALAAVGPDEESEEEEDDDDEGEGYGANENYMRSSLTSLPRTNTFPQSPSPQPAAAGVGPGPGITPRTRMGGLLQEVRVESEIGQRESGKQSLKNVGKVERFVLEQVRRIFEEELVYPSFWTFLV